MPAILRRRRLLPAGQRVPHIAAHFARINSQSLVNTTDTAFDQGDFDIAIVCDVWLDSLSAGNDRDLVTLYDLTDALKQAFGLFYGGANNRFAFAARMADGSLGLVEEPTSPTTERWYHLVVWHDGTANSINLQVDNGTVQTVPVANGGLKAIGPATTPLRVGAIMNGASPDFHFDGRIDNLGYAKTAVGGGGALSSAVRSSLWNNGKSKGWSQLTSEEKALFDRWWDLDEHSGSRIDQVAGASLTASASSPTYAPGKR